jgi:3-hexulose-6-phosphate synthase
VAIEIAASVSPYFEIIEIGTPLILSEGVKAVKIFKAKYPQKIILADMKIADAGDYEATIAYEAGADFVTVLGLADFRTIQGTVAAGKRFGRGVIVDSLNMNDLTGFSVQLENLGVACILVHAATDGVHKATALSTQITEIARCSNIPVAVAGGITPQNIGPLIQASASIFVAGSSVTQSADPRQVAEALRNQVFGRRLP